MKKITNSMVLKVKRHLKKDWHDKDWHAFNRIPEVEAIIYALQMGNKGKDIIIEAEKYLQ